MAPRPGEVTLPSHVPRPLRQVLMLAVVGHRGGWGEGFGLTGCLYRMTARSALTACSAAANAASTTPSWALPAAPTRPSRTASAPHRYMPCRLGGTGEGSTWTRSVEGARREVYRVKGLSPSHHPPTPNITTGPWVGGMCVCVPISQVGKERLL